MISYASRPSSEPPRRSDCQDRNQRGTLDFNLVYQHLAASESPSAVSLDVTVAKRYIGAVLVLAG